MPLSGREDEIDELAGHLNRMLDQIETLMKSMRQVTENVAHDLRQPISRLRTRIELALMGSKKPEVYRETLERTLDEADEILSIFNALLIIANIESGAPRDHFEPLDLTEIARASVELYEPAAEESGLRLKLVDPGPLSFSGNPHLITQALVNLLDNAIKYAGGRGCVTVRVSSEPNEIRLSVADEGPGIPDSFREQALERFSRLDQSRRTRGSGLGLSLVRAVARLHDGDVELSANNPGLLVTIRFPVAH